MRLNFFGFLMIAALQACSGSAHGTLPSGALPPVQTSSITQSTVQSAINLAITPYRVTAIGGLPGGTSSYATWINANGVILGATSFANGTSHCWLRRNDGSFTDMTPGSYYCVPGTVNSKLQAVGWRGLQQAAPRAFLYESSTLHSLSESYLYSIDADGLAVGANGDHSQPLYYVNGKWHSAGIVAEFRSWFGLVDAGGYTLINVCSTSSCLQANSVIYRIGTGLFSQPSGYPGVGSRCRNYLGFPEFQMTGPNNQDSYVYVNVSCKTALYNAETHAVTLIGTIDPIILDDDNAVIGVHPTTGDILLYKPTTGIKDITTALPASARACIQQQDYPYLASGAYGGNSGPGPGQGPLSHIAMNAAGQIVCGDLLIQQ